MTDTVSDTAWSWPEERWRAALTEVRAGRSLKPKKWKGGARAALAISLDLGGEVRALAARGGIDARSAGHYGARKGMSRLLPLLRRHSVPVTVFLPAVAAMHYADDVKTILNAGHELAMNGWIGEDNATLPPDAEQELATGARNAIERIAGLRPVGMRAGTFTDRTLSIARALGLLYDSSLMADDEPYELVAGNEATGLVEIPVSRARNDATCLAVTGQPAAPEAVFDVFRRELEGAYEEGGLCQLTLHPDLIGQRSRIWIVEELLAIARQLPGVWCATHSDIALWCKGRAGQ